MQYCEINICQVMIFRLYTALASMRWLKLTTNQRKITRIFASARIILLLTVYFESEEEMTMFFKCYAWFSMFMVLFRSFYLYTENVLSIGNPHVLGKVKISSSKRKFKFRDHIESKYLWKHWQFLPACSRIWQHLLPRQYSTTKRQNLIFLRKI